VRFLGEIDMAKKDAVVYREFGDQEEPEEALPELPPNQQQIRIQVSRKGKGGKTVTIVSGFVLSAESLAAVAKKLKNQCGSGGSIQGETIEIQGDHAQKLLQVLVGLEYKAKISGG
jgi:translation initiation factor 1